MSEKRISHAKARRLIALWTPSPEGPSGLTATNGGGMAFTGSRVIFQAHCDYHDWHGPEWDGPDRKRKISDQKDVAMADGEAHYRTHTKAEKGEGSWRVGSCIVYQAYCRTCGLVGPERGHHDNSTGLQRERAAEDCIAHNALVHDSRADSCMVAPDRRATRAS